MAKLIISRVVRAAFFLFVVPIAWLGAFIISPRETFRDARSRARRAKKIPLPPA